MADTTFVSKVTVISRAWLQDLNDLFYKGTKSLTVTTLTASTSVVTTQVGTDSSTDFNLKYGGSNIATISGLNFFPSTDNNTHLGGATKRWDAVFTPIIDSGTTGSLLFRTGNG